jgi:hypothetical protein
MYIVNYKLLLLSVYPKAAESSSSDSSIASNVTNKEMNGSRPKMKWSPRLKGEFPDQGDNVEN